MDLKDISEQLSSYIADAEKLERVVEAFREMDSVARVDHRSEIIEIGIEIYEKFQTLIDE